MGEIEDELYELKMGNNSSDNINLNLENEEIKNLKIEIKNILKELNNYKEI